MADITIVTHEGAPGGLPDDRLLAEAFARQGAQARFAVWSDAAVDWSAAPRAVIRSTWDYFNRTAEWFDWITRAGASTDVANGWPIIRWNSDKRYLGELAAAGVSCVPTKFAAAGDRLEPIIAREGWVDLIIKPAIAGGAKGARRFAAHDRDAAQAHLDALTTDCVALIQPFMAAVETSEERSLVFIDGGFSHAWRKPAFNNIPRDYAPHHPSTEEMALARQAIGAVGAPLAYARADMIAGYEGPMLMELELIEPDLGLRLNPLAADALAAACLANR
jgi:glutathione synthase/RimK-type ligase-like ATP-grasp enzyme